MKVLRFQEGGAAPAPEQGAAPAAAPAEGGQQGGGAEEQVAQMAQQIVQQLGPEAAAMLAQMIMQMLQGAQGEQGGAPAEAQGQPTYQRKGGKLVFVGRK